MYLKSLVIQEGIDDFNEIRNITFKRGLNIIIDDTEDGEISKGNNVGKTTFLKIIDICFGANDKKFIWKDEDTGSENEKLRDYINTNKVNATLIFEKNGVDYSLCVDLFNKGKKYINNEKLSRDNFNDKLNKIVFGLDERPPSFRQLIGKFIRIKQKEDHKNIFKYLHGMTSDIEYQNIYEFLFSLSNTESSKEKLNLTKEINQINNDLKKIIGLHKFSGIDDLTQRINVVENHVKILDRKLKVMTSIDEYSSKVKEIQEVKSNIDILNDTISNLEFQKYKVQEILQVENNKDDSIDKELLSEFYNEVEKNIGKLEKHFEELIKFNEVLKANKIDYYNNRFSIICEQLKNTRNQKDLLINRNKNLLTIINENNLSEFELLHEDLLKNSQTLGELKKVEQIYNNLQEEYSLKNKELVKLNEDNNKNDSLTIYNNIFSQYTNMLLKQSLYVSPDNKFPLKLSNVNDGIGTGYRKMFMLLMDIAYVSFIKKLNLNFPKFFVHDVLETVDEQNLSTIVNLVHENESQFVFAVLYEKIESYDFISDDDIVLKLSKEDKLFRV